MAEKGFVIKEGVTVTDEVVAIVAGLAAIEVDGISSLGGGLTEGNISKGGMSKLQKGIRIVREEEGGISVRISANIRQGYEIPAVCRSVQEKVKSSIENTTGIIVKEVDIRVAALTVA